MAKKDEEEAFLTEEEEIQRMAACGFTNTEMALQLGYKPLEFKIEAETKDSKIWSAIQAGKLQSEFSIADKQRTLAESGNITAVQIFEKVKKAKKVQQLKDQIYFGI